MSIEIIFEDSFFVCVSKPNNMVVHHAHHSRNVAEETSLLQILKEQLGLKLYPIHRLDRKTSGIILLAKETGFVSKFQNLFTTNTITKEYLGIVRGHSKDNLIIESPVKGRDSKVYKDAKTVLRTLDTVTLDIPVKPYATSRYSLVKFIPATGRLHQLRIHSNKISHPLIGDPKYGDKNHNVMFVEKFKCHHMFLHAYHLAFEHPFTQKKMILFASLPKDWKLIMAEFNWQLNLPSF